MNGNDLYTAAISSPSAFAEHRDRQYSGEYLATRPPKTSLDLLPQFGAGIYNDACVSSVNRKDRFTAGDLQVSSRNNAIDNIQVNSYLLGLR